MSTDETYNEYEVLVSTSALVEEFRGSCKDGDTLTLSIDIPPVNTLSSYEVTRVGDGKLTVERHTPKEDGTVEVVLLREYDLSKVTLTA